MRIRALKWGPVYPKISLPIPLTLERACQWLEMLDSLLYDQHREDAGKAAFG